ncbi:TPA: YnfC family lipoprotein [Providencia alcalifaciens]
MNNKCIVSIIQFALFSASFQSLAFQKDEYNPIVFNFAQLYDFNPVKGNVKELNTMVYNDDETINYQSTLNIGRDGCVDSFSFSQKKDEHLNSIDNWLLVKREKNKLVGSDANGPVEMEVAANCLIVSRADSNDKLIYQYNNDGIIIGSMNAEPRVQYSKNTYNKNKLPETIKYYKDNVVFSETILSYGNDITKPFDLQMEIKALGLPILFVDSKCDYDKQNIAHRCNFILTVVSNGKMMKLPKRSTTEAVFY